MIDRSKRDLPYSRIKDIIAPNHRYILGYMNPCFMESIQRTNSPQELAAIYTAADVFVNPTYEDNYPTVNLEAQACGTPVITYDTGGCRETIHTDSAKVVEAGNVEGLYKEITIR